MGSVPLSSLPGGQKLSTPHSERVETPLAADLTTTEEQKFGDIFFVTKPERYYPNPPPSHALKTGFCEQFSWAQSKIQ